MLYLHLPGRAQAGEGLHVLLWDQQEGMDVVARTRVRQGCISFTHPLFKFLALFTYLKRTGGRGTNINIDLIL